MQAGSDERAGRDEDARLVKAIASLHMLFGQDRAAAQLLELANWLAPNNSDTLELMIHANDKLRESEHVLALCKRLEAVADDTFSSAVRLAKGKALARLGLAEDARAYLAS